MTLKRITTTGIVLCLTGLLITCHGAVKTGLRSNERDIQILNDSTRKLEIYWVHPETRETVLMSTPHVVPGGDFPLNSFVGHEFEVREVCNDEDDDDEEEEPECRRTLFQVSENDDQIVRINEDIETVFVDNKIKAQQEANQIVRECQAAARAKMVGATDSQMTAALEELVQCVEHGITGTLQEINEEIAFQASVRREIAARLENYTCVDDTLDSTKDISSNTWTYKEREGHQVSRVVHIKHDRAASKIHVVENFIRPDECIAMEEEAASTLHRATVADGKGGSRFSENRKAMQAGIKVPWEKEDEGNAIARLSRRVFDYTNHVLGLDIKEFGQEDLMSIQYFGRGVNDTQPDRYTPHCDGDCTGLPHKPGTRMATMVMYCVVPERGGHTNFRNAGVHVKPVVGDAVFFSYIDPKTKVMDSGFTEHSGCPVFEGEKKIVTQWIRLGVDEANPWDSFNTLGIKIDKGEN